MMLTWSDVLPHSGGRSQTGTRRHTRVTWRVWCARLLNKPLCVKTCRRWTERRRYTRIKGSVHSGPRVKPVGLPVQNLFAFLSSIFRVDFRFCENSRESGFCSIFAGSDVIFFFFQLLLLQVQIRGLELLYCVVLDNFAERVMQMTEIS